MSGSKRLFLQACLLIGLTTGTLCLTNVDPTALIADRPPPPPPTAARHQKLQWDHQQQQQQQLLQQQHKHVQHGPWRNKQQQQLPRSSAVPPPYAVKMEPMVLYSQQDPLYANFSAKIDYDGGGGGPSAVGVASDYGAPPPDASYGAPYHPPDYYKEPEPIIEIIIKESNESLPAPPPPPPPPAASRPAKEPVQVFYVKYKKNPNAYGDKDDIIYEKPVPAITPLAADAAVGDAEPAYAATVATATEPYPAYGHATAGPPPAPSTTYRTIIKPDSEVYHGTGLKVTFGKPDVSWGDDGGAAVPLNEAQKRDSVSEATADVRAHVKKTEHEYKRSYAQPSAQPDGYRPRNVNDFGSPPPHVATGPTPQFNGPTKSNADFLPPPQQQLQQQQQQQQQQRKPNQQQSFFREDSPRPNFQGQIPIINPQQFKPQQNHFDGVVEQRPTEFKDDVRNQQNHPQFNNQPNYQHLNNQPNIQQFTNQQNHQQLTNPQNHQQFTGPQNHQQFANQQHHQHFINQQNHQQHHHQLNSPPNHQQNHQQFINQPNPQQLNNQQNHQHFTNHQNHQTLINQQSHPQLNNHPGHQQFINQQRPQDFQAGGPPLRNPVVNFQERPAQIKSNNERPLLTQPFENLSLQSKPFENRPPQDLPFDSRPFESRPAPERSLEHRPAFDRPFDSRPNQNRPFENRYSNQPTVNYRPNKPPTPQNIPLNPSFVPSDKRPTVPPPPLPTNYNTQPLGTKHSVDLAAFSPQQQQHQHQQFQKQIFQQQQFQQQYRPADARPSADNGPSSFAQQPIKQQQQQQFTTEVKPSAISHSHQQQSIKQQQQQQFVTESKPSQIPQLQITPSNGYKLEPEEPAQSGQFFETYNGNHRYPPTQTELNFRYDNSPWQVSNRPQSTYKQQPQPQEQTRDYSTTSTVKSAPDASAFKTTERPASYVTSQYKERTTAPTTTAAYNGGGPTVTEAAAKNQTKAADFKNIASLPDEVPDELREQLLSSGILSNADIQILDYDKVGDIPIENLPPEALENLYGQGSAPVPSIALPPGKSDVQMKVVKYDPATEEGRKIENTYIDRPKAQTLPPVVLNDTGYNRFLPLNINGTHFPIPDSPLLKNKAIGSVVILSPVGYDLSDDQSRSSRNTAVKVKGVHFVVGDIVKNLVKDPNRQNFETWLEKEKSTPSEEQSVVLLVTKPNGKTSGKEIYMYDVTHNQVNKLSGELSATFVNVAESNSKSNDLDNLSSDEEVDVVVSGNSTDNNTPVVSGYNKTDDFSSSIVATANN